MIPQLKREAPVSAPEQTTPWRPATRLAFRFVFCYFLLYLYPRAVGSLGSGVVYSHPLRDFWHAVVPWVGQNLLHITEPIAEVANGSGDQLYDYIQLLCIAAIAAVATLIWTILDRKRTEYRTLYQWTRIVVRLALAVAMISYGANKLWRMQFAPPSLGWLMGSYAESSPMRLLWTFMGMSYPYSFFAGCAEMLGGLLLILPRFTVMGVLVSGGVLTNIMMLNMFYDVPRKIYTIHLLLICLFLLLPDLQRLFDFFVLQRKSQLTTTPPLFADKQMNRGLVLLQLGVGVAALIVCSHQARVDAARFAQHLPPPIYGVWNVDQFTMDGTTHPPLTTDNQRWLHVIFDDPELLTIQPMDGSLQMYDLRMDPSSKDFNFALQNDIRAHGEFTRDNPQPDHMVLTGRYDGHTITAVMSREDLSDPQKFMLPNRGIHWINPYPFRW
jgi:uncharacterized membrane protein YphA (DoxX/SURF4 family)